MRTADPSGPKPGQAVPATNGQTKADPRARVRTAQTRPGARLPALAAQLARFGLVGAVGLVVDVGVFNLLRLTVLSPETLHEGPVLAKVASTSLAIVANWLGNRYWTFHRKQRAHPVGEGLRFALVSVAAMVIPLSCLWVSHYALGFTSLLADNISTNAVGLALGMVFRFWLYRAWVFAPGGGSGAPTQPAGAETNALRPAERPVVPAGLTPLHRIQAVAPIDDRAHPHE